MKAVILDPVIEILFTSEWNSVHEKMCIYIYPLIEEKDRLKYSELKWIHKEQKISLYIRGWLYTADNIENVFCMGTTRLICFDDDKVLYETEKTRQINHALDWFEIHLRQAISNGFYERNPNKEKIMLDISRLNEFKIVKFNSEDIGENGVVKESAKIIQ